MKTQNVEQTQTKRKVFTALDYKNAKMIVEIVKSNENVKVKEIFRQVKATDKTATYSHVYAVHKRLKNDGFLGTVTLNADQMAAKVGVKTLTPKHKEKLQENGWKIVKSKTFPFKVTFVK